MPFIEVGGLGDDHEDTVVPEGEYDLRIVAATDKRNKKDTHDMTEVMIKPEDAEYPNPAPVFFYLIYPTKADDDEARHRMMQNITRFLKQFNIKYEKNGFNSEDLVGETAKGLLTQGMYEDQPKNEFKVRRG